MYVPSKNWEFTNTIDSSARVYTKTKMNNKKKYGIDKTSHFISSINKDDKDERYFFKSVREKPNSIDHKTGKPKTAKLAKSKSIDFNTTTNGSKDNAIKGVIQLSEKAKKARRVSLWQRTINETKKVQSKNYIKIKSFYKSKLSSNGK